MARVQCSSGASRSTRSASVPEPAACSPTAGRRSRTYRSSWSGGNAPAECAAPRCGARGRRRPASCCHLLRQAAIGFDLHFSCGGRGGRLLFSLNSRDFRANFGPDFRESCGFGGREVCAPRGAVIRPGVFRGERLGFQSGCGRCGRSRPSIEGRLSGSRGWIKMRTISSR